MRALALLANLLVLFLAYRFGSLLGLLAVGLLCFAIAGAWFALSRARTEARESRDMRRQMGRSTTFLMGLGGRHTER